MPNFPYKLAAIDLDDTLLGPDKLIGSANTDAIRSLQARGVKIVLASGRRLENMRRYCSELGLIGPVITCQGASVVDLTTGESIYERQLDEAKSRAVIEAGLARDLTIIAYQHEGTFANRRNRLTDLYDLRSGKRKVIVKDSNTLPGKSLKCFG